MTNKCPYTMETQDFSWIDQLRQRQVDMNPVESATTVLKTCQLCNAVGTAKKNMRILSAGGPKLRTVIFLQAPLLRNRGTRHGASAADMII
jgi:hypothetical protein